MLKRLGTLDRVLVLILLPLWWIWFGFQLQLGGFLHQRATFSETFIDLLHDTAQLIIDKTRVAGQTFLNLTTHSLNILLNQAQTFLTLFGFFTSPVPQKYKKDGDYPATED